MKVLIVWGHKFRNLVYEVRVNLQDGSGRIFCEVLGFPVKNRKDVPEKAIINEAIGKLVERVKDRERAIIEDIAYEPTRQAKLAKNEFLLAVGSGLLTETELVVVKTELVKALPAERIQ